MGDFKSNNRSGFKPRSGNSSNNSFRGRSEGRSSEGRAPERSRFRSQGPRDERRAPEMHDVTCDKCGKQCQVPFRPTGDKPVYCSNCFRHNEGSNSRDNFNPRNRDNGNRSFQSRPQSNFSQSDRPAVVSSGISQEQFNQLNAKVDKILEVLQSLEMDVDEDEDDFEDDEKDDEDDDEDDEDEDEEEAEA